ncbi:MAG: DNA repair protein RadC [Candidatus Kentron sp. G]|nr:MAG: DNA repair protein RadC [Candidatus Kentron sp. G]VFN03709.1 MAG: DNA repair protein RadC [Candidatus Kentron sp. G]VFN05203.1 MAG: DNA repair protein RadC [Candidatus Kentron sp. G]
MNIKLTERDRIKVINGEDVFDIMRRILSRENKIDQDKEHFWIVGLAIDSRILFIELVSMGAADTTLASPMEVFRVAVLKSAASVILVHNHTANDVTPSDADKDTTDRLIQVGRVLNIHVVDHLVITTKTFLSFEMIDLMDELRKSLKWVPPFEIVERVRAEEKRIRETAVRESKREGEEEGLRKGLKMGRDEGIELGVEKGREEGLQEGASRGRKEVARALLSDGMAIDIVSGYSGLSEEEIRELVGP